MKAREEILRRISSAHVAAPEHQVRRDYVHTRQLPDLLGLFVERVEDYKAAVIRTDPDGVANAGARCLGGVGKVVVPAGLNAWWVPAGLDIVADQPRLHPGELDAVGAVLTSAVVGVRRLTGFSP